MPNLWPLLLTALISIGFALAIFLRSLSIYFEQSLWHVILWQFASWLPAVWLFKNAVSLPKSLSSLKLVMSSMVFAAAMSLWYLAISSNFSPYLGLPDTGYGVFRWFFVAWFFIQLLLFWAAIGFVTSIAKPITRSVASGKKSEDGYFLKSGSDWQKVSPNDIVWIGSEDYYTVIYTKSKTYWTKDRMTKLLERLPKEQFLRIHRSTIINLAALERIEKTEDGKALAHLKGGEVRAISKAKYKALQASVKPLS